MKKKDKIKSGIRMAVGLLLTVCMIFAGALLGGGTAQAVNSAIDDTATGSITIHKYEYNGTEKPAGTGKASDVGKVPTDATALEGVEFTIYQVRTAAQLQNIYQGTTTTDTMPKLSDYCNSDNKTLKAGHGLTAFSQDGLTNPGTTGSDGVVTFAGLPVGIYLVVETDAPPKVTTKSDAFFVSVPTTVDNNDWLYNVHVFPKNATTYGEKVTLIKKGSDNNLLKGVTFVLQRQKDDGTWETVTIVSNAEGDDAEDGDAESGNAGNTASALTTDTSGEITVSDLPPGTYRFIETNIGNNHGYIADCSVAYVFVVSSDGTITKMNTDDDYITVNADGSAEITVINQKPDVEKKVKDKDDDWVQEADYSVGDTISYQVAIKVPENIAKLKTFKVQDTPKGIEYTSETLKVYGSTDGKMDTSKIFTKDTDYTLSEGTPTNGFTVEFIFTPAPGKITDYAGETIYIIYDAVLTEDAVVNAGNTNTVELIYSKYIKPTGDPEGYPPLPPEEEDTIKDSTVVYTFQLDIEKKGKTDADDVPLQGVTFDLYRAATADEIADTDITTVTGDDAKAVGLDKDQHWIKVTSLTTDANGKVSQKRLANGTYYLVETQTNDGYNLLSKPVKVELTTTYTTVFKETYTDTNGIIVKHEITENGTSITQSVKVNDGTDVVTTVTILNTKGFTLPTTGGAGGFLFAVIGCVVMIVGILLFKGTKKKPESE